MDNPQVDSQPEVSIDEVQLLYTPPLQRSNRVRNVPLRYDFVIENDNTPHIIENDDPTIYSEAVMSNDSDKWLEAMKFEIDFIYVNQVWTLIDASEGVTSIDYKWVFKNKIGADS